MRPPTLTTIRRTRSGRASAAGPSRLARAKAEGTGLRNVQFQTGGMLDLGLPAGRFDAVVCVFCIVFVPDTAEAVRALWRVVRPGGRLAVTTSGLPE